MGRGRHLSTDSQRKTAAYNPCGHMSKTSKPVKICSVTTTDSWTGDSPKTLGHGDHETEMKKSRHWKEWMLSHSTSTTSDMFLKTWHFFLSDSHSSPTRLDQNLYPFLKGRLQWAYLLTLRHHRSKRCGTDPQSVGMMMAKHGLNNTEQLWIFNRGRKLLLHKNQHIRQHR